MYNVYVIYNKKYGKVYIGQTRNLEERLNLHQEKQFVHSYTSRFDGEWVLIYTEHVLTRKDALIREKQLKSYQGRQFVRKYIPK
ncbi:MAG: GIY-YIG nuclease family protein [Patescibacteria group bacterium]